MRLIDADKLVKDLELLAKFQPEYKQSTILGVCETIKATKTVDVRPKWISVKDRDRMPLEDYDCKANCSTSDLVLVAVALGDGNRFVCDDMTVDGKWYIHEDNVTHWMPMPDLPEEEEYEFNT